MVGTDPSIEGASGIWTASTAAVFADNTAFTTTASNLADGANIFTWSLSKGTCPPVSADVTITNNQVIANAGTDKPVCGSTTALEGTISPSGTGLWTIITAGPNTVIQNSSDPNSTVTGLQAGANVFKWTTTRSSCSDEDFVTITNDTVQIADGTTQTVCAFEADLVANPLDAGQTGLWTAAGSNPIIQNSTSPTTHVTNLDYGNNAFFWTVTSAGGCSTTKQYNIINNSPTPANAGVDQPLCVDYATVTGNNPIYGTGTWSLSSGAGSIVDANSTSTLINNLGSGTNVFRWTITYNGCTDFDEVNLINNSFTVKAGIDQPLCADSTTLNADAIAGGYWTLVSGSGIIQNSLLNTSAVTNLGQGANTFRWTAVQGSCSASDDVIISNNSVTPPSVLGGGEYCTADGITITGDIPTGTQTGLWMLTGGSGTIAVATDNVTTVSGLSNLTPNKFTWTISDKGCSASAELTIINNSVTADAGGTQTLCADNTNLGAAIPAVGTGYWTVTSSTGIIANSLANNSAVTNLNLGNNIFTWTVERGICSASDNVLIINDSPTTANAGGDQTICPQTTTLNGNAPLVGTGKWSTLSSTAIIAQPTQFDTQVTVDIGSSTQFTWTITNGICSSEDIVTVTNNSFNVYAGINRTLCTDTHVMEADDPGTGTGTWTILSGTGIFLSNTQYNATVSSLGLGENIFRWTITRNGCSVYDDVKLTNSMVSATANNQFLCVDNTILDGNDPSLINSQGLWSVVAPAGANIITPTLFNSAVTNLTSGKNYLKWTVYNQDCSIDKTVEIEYYVPVVNAGGDVPFRCDNQIQLDGNQPPATGSGIWSSVSGSTIMDPTLYNTQVTNLDIGDNVFRWTITDKGCTNWDEVVINNSLPKNDNGSDQSGCTETFVMNAEQPTATGSGLWTVVSSSGTVVFSDNTLYSTIVTVPSGNNILKWTITDNGCSNEKTFNITNNLPNAIASNGDTLKVCRDEVQLSGSQPGVGESGVWTIDGGIISEVFDNASIYNPIVSNLRKGQITFVWTVSNAYCTDEDRAVVVNNTPVVDAGSDRTICEDQINLAANIPGSGESGLWTINSTTVVIDNPTLYNTHVSNLGNTNTFRWTIDNGICTAFDEVIITSRNIDVSAGLTYQEACADTLVLEATDPSTVGSGIGSGFWTAIEGTGTFDNASSYTTIARNLRNYNKLRWTIVDLGCTYYDEIAFVSLLPTEAATGLDKPVCTNTTQITGSTPDYAQGETGLWEVVSGTAQISDPTAFQTVVTSLNSGTNVFSWTISNASCSDVDYITITNNEVFADAGTDQPAVCDSSATISANLLSGTGYWTTTSPTATIQNSLATTTLVEHLSFGANNFQWIVSNNGCTDVDEVIVTSILPRNVDAGADQNICTDNTNLAASNPGIGTGLWQNTGGAGTVADPTANQTTVSGLANNENRFTWTVTVNGCSETDEMSIFNNSIYVNAGTDQTICNQDTLVLNGINPGSGVTGMWSVRGGSGTFDIASVYNTVVRNIAKGINTYRWTLSDGNCTNYAELTVTNNTPDSALVGGDQFICTDNTIINAIPVTNGVGKWSVTSGAGNITDKTSYNTSVTGINKGPNTFRWTVSKNACQLSADLVVTNNSVDAYIADNEVVICTDTHTATIIGNAPGTGETGYWTKQNPADAGMIVNSNSNVTNVTNLANGDTYFTWTIENGSCSNSDVVKVTDNYYNTTATPAGPSTLCVDYSPILGGTPPAGGTGRWSSTAPDVTFDNDTKVSTIVRNLPGGTSAITWTVTKDGCSAPASFNLINNAIYTSAGADQIVCTDYTTMNAQALLSGETGQWTVNNTSVIITDTSDPTTAVSNLIPGANTFTWTIQGNGCTATDEIIVSANAFSVTAGNDDIACGTTYNLAASDPLTGTGLWTVASGTGRFANASNFETVVYDMENGANTFTWTVNRNGCVASDDVIITNNLYIAVAGDDKSICSDQTTVSAQPLNPVWGATGMWTAQTGGGVFTDPTNESTLVTGLAVGNNRLRWTVTKTESGTTCTSYDEMIVTNNSVTASAGTNETTCDDFITLSATPLSSTATGLWSGGGVTTTIVNPTSATTLVTGLQQGANTFSWTVKDNGCEGTSSVQITSNHFVANAGGDQIVTVNTATMNALLPDATATGNWTTISGSGTPTNPNDPNDVVTALGYGVNTFRWEVTWNSCTNYDDVNITYNSITADAGANQTICASTTTMSAGDPFPGTGTWSVISGSATIADINNPNTQVTDIQPGSLNILRWTVEIGGYSEYDDVSILNGEFTISAGIDKEECTNESVMTAEDPGAGTGSWSVLAGGGNFDDNSLNTSRVTNLDEGINLFVWSVTKTTTGCSNSDTVQIIYNLPPSAAFEMDQSDGCSPIDVTFTNTTTGGSVYYWYFKNDFRVDSSLTSFTRTYEASYDADSTYFIQLIAESSKGCTDTVEHTVTVYRIPRVDFSATPSAQLYPRTEVFVENLSGSGYPNYYWDMGDGNTYLHNTLVENFSHSYATWGEYIITLTVSENNCSDTVRETVVIYPPQPESTIKPGIRAQGCEDLSVNFESYVNYADTFYWDFGDGGSSNEQNPTYIYDTPGTFIVTLYAGGPGTNDSLITVRRDTVVVFEVPIADFEVIPDTVMLPDQPVILHNNSINGDRYQWTFGGVGDAISTDRSPVHYYTEPGIYTITLEVWTDNDCYDTKTIENAVVVEPAGTFVFPTAFNPFSSYESNKVFKPKYRGIKEYKLEVYNRWGEKVFESTDPEIGWDGYIDGKIGAQDVYAWKVTGKYKNGAPFQGTGDVTLLR
ncbi:MAG: PKD domain-containing protein [Bacteroidales bacterium]|nr:PKD domain-containing protein [Bacteroidales bacterium]